MGKVHNSELNQKLVALNIWASSKSRKGKTKQNEKKNEREPMTRNLLNWTTRLCSQAQHIQYKKLHLHSNQKQYSTEQCRKKRKKTNSHGFGQSIEVQFLKQKHFLSRSLLLSCNHPTFRHIHKNFDETYEKRQSPIKRA